MQPQGVVKASREEIQGRRAPYQLLLQLFGSIHVLTHSSSDLLQEIGLVLARRTLEAQRGEEIKDSIPGPVVHYVPISEQQNIIEELHCLGRRLQQAHDHCDIHLPARFANVLCHVERRGGV